MPRIVSLRLLFAVTTLIALFPYSGYTQTEWLLPRTNNGIAIEFAKVNWDYPFDYFAHNNYTPKEGHQTWSAFYFVHGWVRIWDKFSLRLEVPVSSVDFDYDVLANYWSLDREEIEYYYSEGVFLGNPYVGVEYSSLESGPLVRAGYRFSYVDAGDLEARGLGTVGAMNRPEAFMPFTMAISVSTGYRRTATTDPLMVAVIGGPTLFIHEYSPNEGYFDYSLMMGVEYPRFDLQTALQGRYWITEENLDFDQRNEVYLATHLSLKFGHIRPGVRMNIPLQYDNWPYLNYVYAFDMSMTW